jgi:hypothetical protein
MPTTDLRTERTMLHKPDPEVRAEIIAFLQEDQTRLGQVYRLTEQGLDPNAIASALGVSTSGFVANYRSHALALHSGVAPTSSTLAVQTAARIRTLLKSQNFSEPTRLYLQDLHDALASAPGPAPSRGPKPLPSVPLDTTGSENLRDAVDQVLRLRTTKLIEQIKAQVGLDADDYFRIVSAPRALDQLVDLIDRQVPSGTSLALFQKRQFELSIEQETVNWSADLPLTSSLVESARGRLQYWMNE